MDEKIVNPEIRAHRPLVELLLIAGPTVAQMASYTVMQFIDTLMLSRVGVDEPTAAANSGLLTFSIVSLGIGVLSVVNTLVSQNFGQGDFKTCGRYLWQGVWFSVVFSALMMPLMPLGDWVFRSFGHEPVLVRMEATYLRIVLVATLFKMIGNNAAQFLLAINRPHRVLTATLIGVGVNAMLGWMLILGKWGFPRLGVAGAAWAQNAGVLVEMGMLILFVMLPHVRKTFNVLDWRVRWGEMRTLLRVGVPAGVQFVGDVLAWSVFSLVVMNQFGTRAMAANAFMLRYMVVSFMPALGIGIAVTALVGRYIGMGRPDIAEKRANLAFLVTAGYMMGCGVVFLFGRNLLIGLFTEDPEVKAIGSMLLVFAAVYQLFDAMYIVYNGALRGAGDTFVPAVATTVLNWGISVTGGYWVAVEWHQFGAGGPWTAVTIYGITLGVFMLVRFRIGGWKGIRLEEEDLGLRT